MMNAETAKPTANHSAVDRGYLRRGSMRPRTLSGLMATWAKLSPQFDAEPLPGESARDAERRVRMAWANGHLHPKRLDKGKPDITSFCQLDEGEARFLLKSAREESGDGPAYRALLIGRLAAELWGAEWDQYLDERVMERFGVRARRAVPLLTPRQAHEMIEELLSRIARRERVEIEEARKRFLPQRRRG